MGQRAKQGAFSGQLDMLKLELLFHRGRSNMDFLWSPLQREFVKTESNWEENKIQDSENVGDGTYSLLSSSSWSAC